MRHTFMLAMVMIFVTGGWAPAQSQESLPNSGGYGAPLRRISVAGTVETKTAPDQILWSVSLSDTDKDMQAAISRNDEKIKSLVALREKLGVGVEDMETGTISIQREYERGLDGARGEFKHFAVHRNVTIRQRDLKQFDVFLETLVSSSEMEMRFSFESSNIHEIRAETRLYALKAAKDKASAMAEAVGARLGKVLTIDETAQGDGGMRGALANNISFSQSTPSVDLATEKFIPGAISVRVTVYATFELE